MESGGVTLTSSLTYESGERIKGERGDWGLGSYLREIIYLFFLSSPGDLFLSSSHGKFFLLHSTLLFVNYSKSFGF